jgi:[acyl-carrier-protein] S-malonyltransferase
MGKIALVFPGQGTQHTGMGKLLYAEHAAVRDVFDQASSVLGMDIGRLCFAGPQETLDLTINTQIAVLTFNIALYTLFKNKTAIEPVVMAGHSLGEYSALYAAGTADFSDIFKLVQSRARYHQEAVAPGEGAMAAIIGMDDVVVEKICAEINDDKTRVSVAIQNGPSQIVVSGHTSAVEKVMLAAKQKGAMKVARLPISAPCHCSLLQRAADMFGADLDKVEFRELKTPVIPNCDPDVFYTKDNARQLLIRQIVSPVKWRQTVDKMTALGVETIIEIGPKRTLCGLIKRINKDISLFSVEDSSSLQKTLDIISS